MVGAGGIGHKEDALVVRVKQLRGLRGARTGTVRLRKFIKAFPCPSLEPGFPTEVHITQIPSRSPDRRINQIPFFFLTQRNRLMMTGVLGGPLGKSHPEAEATGFRCCRSNRVNVASIAADCVASCFIGPLLPVD